METLTSTQTALFIGVVVIVLGVTHYAIFACVYFIGFIIAFICSNTLLGRSNLLESRWTVTVLKHLTRSFRSMEFKYTTFRKVLEKNTVKDSPIQSGRNDLNESTEHLHLPRKTVQLSAKKDVLTSKPFENLSHSSHSERRTVESMIELFVSYIIRDFICSWFHDISDNVQVVQGCTDMLQVLLEDLLKHSKKQDQFELFDKHITLFLGHLHDYHLSVARFKSQPSYRKKRDKERKEFKKLKSIEDCFDFLGKFHDVNNNSEKELSYWQCLLEVILMKSADKNLTYCFEAKHLLVDILASQVFLPLVDVLSDPHWLHKAIILITSEEEIEVIDRVENQLSQNHVQASPENITRNRFRDTSISVMDASCEELTNTEEEMNIEQFTTTALGELFPLTMSPQDSPIHADAGYQSAIDAQAEEEKQPIFSLNEDFQDCYDDSDDELSLTDTTPDFLTRDQYIPEGSSFSSEGLGEDPHDTMWKNTSDVDGRDDTEHDTETMDSQHVRVSDADEATGEFILNQDSTGPSHLFEEVQIVQTKSMKEAGGNGTFTMYCIKTSAWTRNEPAGRGWRLREISVWRRYREFLTLHDRLQEHVLYKTRIKGIKGPTRWRVIGKMDKDTVDKRQTFLQAYLQRLTMDEMIGKSMALREFLAYNGDANIAFVKKASDIPRIDKLLVKTFSGVFDKLTSVFDDVPTRSSSKQALDTCDTIDTDLNLGIVDVVQVEYDFDREESQLFTNMLAEFIRETDLVTGSSEFTTISTNPVRAPRSAGDGCEHNTKPGGIDCFPLMESVINLALCSVGSRETWIRKHRSVHMFKVALGKAFDLWLHCEIEEITTKERFVHYLQKLSDTLWPDGELDRQHTAAPSEQQKVHTEEQARRCLHSFFPKFLPYVVGQENFKAAIEEILSCLSHPRLNRNFVYKSLDWALQTLYPDLGLPELQMTLLNLDPIHSDPQSLHS